MMVYALLEEYIVRTCKNITLLALMSKKKLRMMTIPISYVFRRAQAERQGLT
jgi:hypothetical protein